MSLTGGHRLASKAVASAVGAAAEGVVDHLTIGTRTVATVFDLLGWRENDLTYSLGWALSHSPRLFQALLADLLPHTDVGEPVGVSLQQYSVGDRGFTDIELVADRAHVVVEAKRGWTLPTRMQLDKYASRVRASQHPLLVAVSECSSDFVASRERLPATANGVPVVHRRWQHLDRLTLSAANGAGHAEKRLLRELSSYLRGVMTVQDRFSNWVYVVSLGSASTSALGQSSRSMVLDRRLYVHPFARSGWPKTPPNFLGFRWEGNFRQVHHVEGCDVVDDLSDVVPGAPPGVDPAGPNVVYRLGTPIVPPAPVPYGGKNYRAIRMWCALDLLLTSESLADAKAATKTRQSGAGDRP